MEDLAFFSLFKSDLLLYSWNQLKTSNFLGNYGSVERSFTPFSNFWFEKTAFLIRKGKFIYKSNKNLKYFKYKNKGSLFITLTQYVIQLSFINIIEQILHSRVYSRLTTCLRCSKGKVTFY